jgi:hypothetical protein
MDAGKNCAGRNVRPTETRTGDFAMSDFAVRNLAVLNYAQGFTMWVYKCGDTALEAVKAPDFFVAAADMMAIGDVIVVSGSWGAAMLAVTVSSRDHVLTAGLTS